MGKCAIINIKYIGGGCIVELNEEINKIIAELEYKEAKNILNDILEEIQEKKSANFI